MPIALRLASLLLTLLSAVHCSQLPDYAQPQTSIADPDSVDRSDTIGYRTLTREDFRATSLAPEMAAHAEKLGALTCAHVVTTPDTSYEIQEQRDASGESTFIGRFRRLGFVAEMNRKCSWWNDQRGGITSDEYVLQHEQIHFALTEIEARRRNAQARALVSEFSVTAPTLEEAKERIQAELTEIVEDAMDDLLERNRDFDEDTSAKHDPAKQQEWFELVSRELAQ